MKTKPSSIELNELTTKDVLQRFIRVNHAGEFGAVRIYEGQLAALKYDVDITDMLEHEKVHLEYFNNAIIEKRVRPTVLKPIWHVGGWLLGYLTAKASKETAMVCTVAVEDIIIDHYNKQLDYLKTRNIDNDDIAENIQKFCDDEKDHHDFANNQVGDNKKNRLLTKAIKKITSTAIWLSERI